MPFEDCHTIVVTTGSDAFLPELSTCFFISLETTTGVPAFVIKSLCSATAAKLLKISHPPQQSKTNETVSCQTKLQHSHPLKTSTTRRSLLMIHVFEHHPLAKLTRKTLRWQCDVLVLFLKAHVRRGLLQNHRVTS